MLRGERGALSRSAIRRKSNARKSDEHQGPGRRFRHRGKGRGAVADERDGAAPKGNRVVQNEFQPEVRTGDWRERGRESERLGVAAVAAVKSFEGSNIHAIHQNVGKLVVAVAEDVHDIEGGGN